MCVEVKKKKLHCCQFYFIQYVTFKINHNYYVDSYAACAFALLCYDSAHIITGC